MHRSSPRAPTRSRAAPRARCLALALRGLLIVGALIGALAAAPRAQQPGRPAPTAPRLPADSGDVLTIVAFGANATANHDSDRVYPQRLADLLASRGVPADVINAGAPGDTTARARARFTWDVLAHRPDLVVIEFGFNDSTIDMSGGERSPRVSQKEFVTNLEAMLDTLDEKGIPVVLMTSPPVLWNDETRERFGHPPYDVDDRWGFNLLSETYAGSVRQLAKRRDVPLLDLYQDFVAFEAVDGQQLDVLLHEGHHPGDVGHERIAGMLAQRVADMLAEGSLVPRQRRQADLPPGPRAVFVAEGRAVGVYDPFGAWQTRDGLLWGTGSELLADHSLLPGDFELRAEFVFAGLGATAAAFRMGGSYFGFDGLGSTFYVSGPLFDNRITEFGPTSPTIVPGQLVLFEVERIGDQMRFLVNGQLIHAKGHAGPLDDIGFAPLRAEMGIKSFTVRGRVRPRPVPLPIAYSLPVVDLSQETDRQVVVDRDPDLYLGHPTTVLLDDRATIITVYPEGHGRGAIRMKRSADGGLTWSEPLPMPANWASSQETPTIFKVKTPRGTSRLLLFSGLYPIRMSVSDDNGLSWTPLSAIGDFGGIVAMSSVAQLSDGTILALFHDDGRFLRNAGRWSSMNVYKTTSKDGGESWSQPAVIAHRPDVHLCEPGLVRSPDGRRLAVLLRENRRARNSFIIFSDDEGATWSEPRELPAALTGDRHVAKYAPDGRLVVTFRDTTLVSDTWGDWVAWVGTWDDLVQGGEGQYRVRLMDNTEAADCAYPGLELLPDGTFVATTYGHWTEDEPPYIVSVRFTMPELDERLAAQLAARRADTSAEARNSDQTTAAGVDG